MSELLIDEIILDFESVKLPPDRRSFIVWATQELQSNGNLSYAVKSRIRKMEKRYNRQLKELRESRLRAKRTNWRKREGISTMGEQALIDGRKMDVVTNREDLGI